MAVITSFPFTTQSFSGLSSVTTLDASDKFLVVDNGADRTITLGNLRNLISGAGGSSTFISLTDAPSSYSGQAGKFPVVNSAETALQFTGLSFSQISGGTFSGVDSLFYITDNNDNTRRFQFQASGISAGTTRLFEVPNFDGTFATLAGVETLLNKTITSPTLITPILGTPQSGTLTNCTGFPAANLSGLGSGVATLLATFNKANLNSALSDDDVVFIGANNTLTGANTISTAGAASTPALVISGIPYSAGTATTNFPLVYINEAAATASTTLSTSGTSFGINKDTSNGYIFAAMVDGVKKFTIDGGGITYGTGGYWMGTNNLVGIFGESSGVMQMGNDAASPVAQTLKGADARSGTDTDTAGGNFTLAAGRGTGTGLGGTLKLQTAAVTTTGTAAGTLTDRLTIASIGTITIPSSGAASAPALTISGVPYSAGTATTNFPLVYINESAATASTTLSTSGTMFGINKDASTGDFAQYMIDGSIHYTFGATTFDFVPSGTNAMRVNGSRAAFKDEVGLGASGVNPDVFLQREGAAILQMGADAAAPVAQTFKGADARSGTDTNTAGGNMSIAAGRGTGTAAGGNLQLQTAVATTTGTSAGTLVARQFIYGGEKSLTESSATVVVNISLASSKYLGGTIIATTHADDATDFQSITDELTFAAVNKGGTVTVAYQATPSTSGSGACSTGTLTTAWTVVNNGAGLDIKCNAASSLTQTTLKTSYQLIINTDGTPTITP